MFFYMFSFEQKKKKKSHFDLYRNLSLTPFCEYQFIISEIPVLIIDKKNDTLNQNQLNSLVRCSYVKINQIKRNFLFASKRKI